MVKAGDSRPPNTSRALNLCCECRRSRSQRIGAEPQVKMALVLQATPVRGQLHRCGSRRSPLGGRAAVIRSAPARGVAVVQAVAVEAPSKVTTQCLALVPGVLARPPACVGPAMLGRRGWYRNCAGRAAVRPAQPRRRPGAGRDTVAGGRRSGGSCQRRLPTQLFGFPFGALSLAAVAPRAAGALVGNCCRPLLPPPLAPLQSTKEFTPFDRVSVLSEALPYLQRESLCGRSTAHLVRAGRWGSGGAPQSCWKQRSSLCWLGVQQGVPVEPEEPGRQPAVAWVALRRVPRQDHCHQVWRGGHER